MKNMNHKFFLLSFLSLNTIILPLSNYLSSCKHNSNENDFSYLSIEAKEDSTLTFVHPNGQDDKIRDLQYSNDGLVWKNYEEKIIILSGTKIYLKGNNHNIWNQSSSYTNKIVLTGNVNLSGDVMSLIDDGNYQENYYFNCSHCFYKLFAGSSATINAKDLILPVINLNFDYCYTSMFEDCENLVFAPSLPAVSLSHSCYRGMFSYCASLESAPELIATNLAPYCYQSMFLGCTSLVNAPKLPSRTILDRAYSFMFAKCTSLVNTPELPAMQLYDFCYEHMFDECTSLQKAPDLPAIYMAESCYTYMFANCASLQKAPDLPAYKLKKGCYCSMFYNCESLNQIPSQLPAVEMAESCYYEMFAYCPSITTIPILPAMTLANDCYSFMFCACGLITSAELPSIELSQGCYRSIFLGCNSLNNIKIGYNEIIENAPIGAFENWNKDVASKGTFYYNGESSVINFGFNGEWVISPY